MPNLANITKPILVIGPGRSGSSWLVDILAQHPAVQPLTENSLITTMYSELHQSWWSDDWGWLCDEAEKDRRITRALRNLYCELFPASEPMWVMKMLWRGRPWDFVHRLFPDALYLHIVRHPCTAIPSMMEYMGANNPVWQEVSHATEEYLQGNRDALEVRKRGWPYLLIRQEDAQRKPEKVWDEVSEFLGLSPEVPFLELRRKVNLAASTRRLPSVSRAPLSWTGLPDTVRAICRDLGYLRSVTEPAAAAQPQSQPAPAAAAAPPPPPGPDQELVESLRQQIEEQNRTIAQVREKYNQLLGDYRDLESGRPPAEPAAAGQAAQPPESGGGQDNPPARVERVETRDDSGRAVTTFDAMQVMHLVITVTADQEVAEPCLGFSVYEKSSGEKLFGTNTVNEGVDLPALAAGDTLEVDFGFTQVLAVGIYGVRIYLTDNPAPHFRGTRCLHQVWDAHSFRVANPTMKLVHHKFLNPVSVRFGKE